MLRFLRTGSKRTKTIWWALIGITVVSFLGGFVFLLGSGLDSSYRARIGGAIGTVNGKPISHTELQNAIAEQRDGYKRQFGVDPGERDMRRAEVQAWRTLVVQSLLDQEARQVGLVPHDREVVVTLQTNPPNSLVQSPVFQTDGKFDPQKYAAAMRDPNNNWAPFEDQVRRQMPMRKLQERLLSSIKVSEAEIRDLYEQRSAHVTATVVAVPPTMDGNVPAPTDADLQRAYDHNKGRFTAGPRCELEVLLVPKKFGDEELRAARELANGLIERARKGEDFSMLAKDYSESEDASRGGVMDRTFQPIDFGAELAPTIAGTDTGGIVGPVQDGGRFVILKILGRIPMPGAKDPSVRLAQIVVRSRPNEETLRTQLEDVKKLRKEATRIGLGKAAAAKGLPTSKTGYFDYNSTPAQLSATPEAAEWGLGSKQGDVSHVFEGPDDFVLCQVVTQSPGGPAPREELTAQLRQIAEIEKRLDLSKAKVDAIQRAVAGGQSLEAAAAAVGATTFRVENMSRVQPDPRLNGAFETIGAMFGSQPGKVVGPIRELNAYFFARVESHTAADPAQYAQARNQLLNELLERRQNSFFSNYVTMVRSTAKVKDLRQTD